MKKEIVLRNTLVTLLALIIFAAVSMGILSHFSRQDNIDNIKKIAEIFKINFEFSDSGNYYKYTDLSAEAKKSMRITVISSSGEVLSDSHIEASIMENHIDRPEVLSLLNGQATVEFRKSESFDKDMMYYAFKVYSNDNTQFVIVRVASDTKDINSYLLSSIPVLIVLIIVVVLVSVVFTLRLNRSILKAFKIVEINLNRINKGTYKMVMPTFKQQEINSAVIGLNDIQQKIKQNIENLSLQSKKLDHVLENTEQGIIALDKNLNIILINNYAREIFDLSTDISSQNLLYTGCGKQFYDNILAALNGGEKHFEHLLKSKTFSVKVNANADNEVSAVVMISDITALKRMESLRSDFFANTSHELKTPLTSILGFSELLEKEDDIENIKKYTSYIVKDSKRMLNLIDDMLKLSRLDSRLEYGKKQTIELAEIASEVKENLKIMAEEKNVAINISGNAKIVAVRDNIYELIENLVSNAIRYNHQDGQVSVAFENSGKKTQITISDTGIGIEKSQQSRVFERFYRVDKGRSKLTGGTGLGLSIVKHIVNLYNGSIELDSILGKGTTIVITL